MTGQPVVSTDLAPNEPLLKAIRDYWNEHIHDLEIATQPVGTAEFFQELDAYRFDKLRYLPQLINFSAFKGKRVLEVGCGAGIDLVRFARGEAIVTGVDLAETSIDLAKTNFRHNSLSADLYVMDGERLQFEDQSFDVVYAHGVLQYTANPQRMVNECYRVLRPGGEAIMMVYNKYSWLNLLSKVMNVELEHADAPALEKYSIWEFKTLLKPFTNVRIVPERFPVRTQLHHGAKAALYNGLFVKAFRVLPKQLVRPLGWHLVSFALKG